MDGVVDRLSQVRDILEDEGIDKYTDCDQSFVTDKNNLWSALQDGAIDLNMLVDGFAELSNTLFKINKAVNE